MPETHAAILAVNPDTLVDLLQLPKGTQITAARVPFTGDAVEFVVRHPDLQLVQPLCQFPNVAAERTLGGFNDQPRWRLL